MKKFADWVIRFRLLIIVLVSLLTVFFAYQLKNIRVNSDILSYLRQDDPDVILFNRIGEEYAGTSIAMVGIASDNVFTYKTLLVVDTLTEKIKQINGIASVMSLTDVLDIRNVDGGLEVGRLIDKNNIPKDVEELNRIRNYTLSKDMYNGRIVSPDGKITIIIARLQQNADKERVAAEIKQLALEKAKGYKLYFSGLPMQMLEVNDIIVKDMIRLVPVVALMLVFMLYFSFRSKRGVLLPLLTVLISTVWALGLMTLLGIQLSIISNIMPVLLLAIGSAYGIHMIARYQEDIHSCPEKDSCIKEALSEVGIPIVLAGITTLIGFFSFVGSYLTSVTEFGVFTGIGVGFALLLSITLLPAILSYLHIPNIKRTKDGKEDNALVIFMDRLATFVLKNEKLILVIGGLIVVFAIIGLPRLKREVNMVDYFKENTDIRIAENMMEKNFGGSTPIQILVKGDLKNPFVLKQMCSLEKYLETVPYVSKPQSVADLICEMNKVMNNHYTIPDTREGVANLWFFIEGESIMKQLVNAQADEGIIQANLATVDTKKIVLAVNSINRYIARNVDTSLVIVKVDKSNKDVIIKHIINEATKNIRHDFKRYGLKNIPEQSQVAELIHSIMDQKTVQWTQNDLKKINEKLNDFFLDESEIEIDDERIVGAILADVQRQLEKGQLPTEQQIVRIIKKNLKNRYAFSNEDINDTAASIHLILNEMAQYKKLMAAVDKWVTEFAPHFKNKAKLRADIRDDLWLINEKHFGIPESLALASGISGKKVHLNFIQSGMPVIFTKLDASLLKSQIQSLLIALILVTIILIIQMRSFIGGIISVSPIVLTVLINFALMAYLGIPLDNATMMIASIAIGIGIDYSIHFTNRFKEELKRSKRPLKALDKTLVTTGKAIVINALSVGMGFLVLLFAQLIPIQRFGWLTAATMLFSSLGAITFLPALILFTKARFVGDFKPFSIYKKRIN